MPKSKISCMLFDPEITERTRKIWDWYVKLFYINVYGLLYPSDTLSFETPFRSMNFLILSEVLVEPFWIFTPIGDSLVSRKVYRNCTIPLSHSVTLVYLIDL